MMIPINPRLAIVTGCLLAFLSAGVNACYLLGLGTSVSHLTGDVTKVAMNVVEGHDAASLAMRYLLLATAGFLSGATLAGFFIHHPNIEFTRPYGRALIGVGVALGGAHLLFVRSPLASVGLAGLACGFQNALATHYRGMVLRTTHITGLLTDLGTSLGMRLKGHSIATWKLFVPVLIIACFFVGSLGGCVVFFQLGRNALLFYAAAYVGLGILWVTYRIVNTRRVRRTSGIPPA